MLRLLYLAAAVASTAAAAADQTACSGGEVVACSGFRSPHEYMDLIKSRGYDKTLRPPCGDGSSAGPTVVEVQLYVTQVNKVDQKLEQVTVNGYLRSWWTDSRLAFNSTADGGCLDEVAMMDKEYSGIWQPDLYVDNLVSVSRDGGSLMEVSSDGGVWMSEQVMLTVKSPIDLGKLPFDSHILLITVASYSQSIARMRVVPRGGVVGAASSGTGIVAPHIYSTEWHFGSDVGRAEESFETEGWVEERSSWDYLTLHFEYTRRPTFFLEQVIMPSVLFLLVSYIQFWVDPAIAPARATLAVIPVLIMRTLSNSVYRRLPEGSQRMWLSDFMTTATFISVLAACEFGAVQFAMLQERRRAAKLAGLQKAEAVADKLFNACKDDGISLLDMLARCSAQHDATGDGPEQAPSAAAAAGIEGGEVKVDVDRPSDESAILDVPRPLRRAASARSASAGAVEQAPTGESGPCRVKSLHAVRNHMSEADVLFIRYAQMIFQRFDDDRSHCLRPEEVRKALTYFNIFLSTVSTAYVMCMFLRDQGQATPLDEMDATMTFDEFTRLLTKVGSYTAHAKMRTSCLTGLRARLQSMPPSRRFDYLTRLLFPVLLALMVTIYYLLLPVY